MRLQRANKVWKMLYCVLLLVVLCVTEVPSGFAVEELTENTWTALPEQPNRQFCGVAAVDGKIYGLFPNTVLVYDPQAGTWTTKYPSVDKPWGDGETQPAPFTTAVIDDKIYFFGHGVYMEGMLNNKVYDTSANHWSNITPDPHSRIDPSACVVDGKIYLIGGSTSSLIETYDPATDTWETKQSLNKPVLDPMALAIEDKIYVFGAGYIQIYDTQTDQWTTLTDQNGDQTLKDAAATAGKYAPQKIYAFRQDAVYVFDPKTNTYTDNISYPEYKSEQYPNVTFGHYRTSKVAVVDDVFYLIGGGVIGTLEKQWTTSEGKIKKSSEPISIAFDYRFVPLGYDSGQQEGSGGFEPIITFAGIVVAASIVAALGVLVYHRKRVKVVKQV